MQGLYWLHALTALHAGTGTGEGFIDAPIARERASHLPIMPGSGTKGPIRELLKPASGVNGGLDADEWEALFGPPAQRAEEHAGALLFNDARLLCLPVRKLAR